MSSIFSSILTGSFTLGQYLLCLLFAGLCGAIAALSLRREGNATRSFLISLVVLPIIVTTVILMVNGNVGTGIAVAGAFSLVRFRSAAGPQRGGQGAGHLRDLPGHGRGPGLRGGLHRDRPALHADRVRLDPAALPRPDEL